MKYVLGLDIGIASVGWAVLDPESKRIVDLGVRAFTAAEVPKNKAPLAEPRRLARSARRTLRRRAGRMRRVKELCAQRGLVRPDCIESAFLTARDKPDPWMLRAEGLDRLLTPEEFARVLFHIAKRRGFKSNRKNAADKEEGLMLECIQRNRQLLAERGYRTVGEMMFMDGEFAEHRRNKADSYKNTVDRSMLEDEIAILFAAQRRHGSAHATADLENEYLTLFRWQMPFASGDAVLRKVGKCTFEPDEYRAPRNCPTTERFTLLQKANQLAYIVGSETIPLTPEQRALVISEAYRLSELKYSQIRKALDLSEDARFPGLPYMTRKDGELIESLDCEKRPFSPMKGYQMLRKAFTNAGLWDDVKDDWDTLDRVAFALTVYKTDEDIRNYFADERVTAEIADAVAGVPGFSKFGHLSLKALRNIIPQLETGCMYHEACEKAGYNHSRPSESERLKKLPVIDPDDVRNPVALRALTQARKVLNAVIERYGSPWRVQIELARDIGKSGEERDEISRRIEKNRKTRDADREHFLEALGEVCPDPRGDDMMKWRLYREQDGKCAYSQTPLDLERLLEPGYVEIDHIIPYSRSFDDMPANKALCLGRENREKKNRTPYEYLGANEPRWAKFEAWVYTLRDFRKRRNFLRKTFDAKTEQEWMERNLNDTRYICRYFRNLVADTLAFADENEKIPAVTLNGRVVAMARGLWGLKKIREENDLHHALDAAVVAALTPGQVKRITEYRQARETQKLHPGEDFVIEGETVEFRGARDFAFPQPWKLFRKELLARLSEDPAQGLADIGLDPYPGAREAKEILVSRMPRRKASGAIHAETIRSIKHLDKGVSAVKKRLASLSMADLDKLAAPQTNERLYAAIRQRMEEFGGDAAKAFAEPLHKPTNDGSLGPVVKSVKVCQTQNAGVELRGGIADNASMVRIDLSREKGKSGKWQYYAAPVYAHDLMRGRLPELTGEFLFSLYPYDLIMLVRKGEPLIGYYRKYNIHTKSITICDPNSTQLITEGIGIRNAELFVKYEVDVLGNYHVVRSEQRSGVESDTDRQTGEADD